MTNILLAIIAAIMLFFLHGCVSFADSYKKTDLYKSYDVCSKYYKGDQLTRCQMGQLIR